MSDYNINLDNKAVGELKEAVGGSTVVANETLSGDEANLTELTVDGTKYAVPQGGGGVDLYIHNITLGSNFGTEAYLTILTPSETAFTLTTLGQYIIAHGGHQTLGDELWYMSATGAIVQEQGGGEEPTYVYSAIIRAVALYYGPVGQEELKVGFEDFNYFQLLADTITDRVTTITPSNQ